MPTLQFVYGGLQPTENLEAVEAQMRVGHQYGNALLPCEHRRREQLRILLRAHPTIGPAQLARRAAVRELDERLRELLMARSDARQRKVDPALNVAVEEARTAYKVADKNCTKVKDLAFKTDPALKAACDALYDERTEKRKKVRHHYVAEMALWCGTYGIKDQAWEQACTAPVPLPISPGQRAKLTKKEKKKRSLRPGFKRFDGSGVAGSQIGPGMTVEDVFSGKSPKLWIEPVSPFAWDEAVPRGERRRAQRTTAHVRVRVLNKKESVVAVFPIVMHRPLPPNALIKWVKIRKERIGEQTRWSLLLSFDLPAPVPVPPQNPDGVLALDLDWRKRSLGLRAGYVVSSTGEEREILVSNDIMSRFRTLRILQSIRDTSLDDLKAWFVPWLAGQPIPDVLREVRKTRHDKEGVATTTTKIVGNKGLCRRMRKWKAPRRFNVWIRLWGKNRWEGDEAAWQRANGCVLRDEAGRPYDSTLWREKDRHLWLWETHLRDKVYRRRQHEYRVAAAHDAENYAALVLEDIDLRVFQWHEPAETVKGENPRARAQQPLVSPSEVRAIWQNAFERRGRIIYWVDATDSTNRCNACGHINDVPPEAVWFTCAACGASWDRDPNACKNLLERQAWWVSRQWDKIDRAAVRMVDFAAAKKKSGGRWQRRKADKADKAEKATSENKTAKKTDE